MKAHYGGQKMLSQILFFEIVWFSTSTKPRLKEIFINYAKNKVIELPNNTISKETKVGSLVCFHLFGTY